MPPKKRMAPHHATMRADLILPVLTGAKLCWAPRSRLAPNSHVKNPMAHRTMPMYTSVFIVLESLELNIWS